MRNGITKLSEIRYGPRNDWQTQVARQVGTPPSSVQGRIMNLLWAICGVWCGALLLKQVRISFELLKEPFCFVFSSHLIIPPSIHCALFSLIWLSHHKTECIVSSCSIICISNHTLKQCSLLSAYGSIIQNGEQTIWILIDCNCQGRMIETAGEEWSGVDRSSKPEGSIYII